MMNNKHITKNLRTMFLIIVHIIVFVANVVFTNAATCATFSTLPQTNTITTDCTVDVPKDILSQTSIVINGVQDSNGNNPKISHTQFGGHFQVKSNAKLTVTKIDIYDGKKDVDGNEQKGGAIYIEEDGHGVFNTVKFVQNKIQKSGNGDGYGAAVYIENNAIGEFKNVDFENNEIANGNGGAVYIDGTGKGYFSHCTFKSNVATDGKGGAIYVSVNAFAEIVKSNFIDNTAPNYATSGVHIYYLPGQPLTLVESTFTTVINNNNFDNKTAVYGIVRKCSKDICGNYNLGNAGIGCTSKFPAELGIECKTCEAGKVRVANSSKFTCSKCLKGTYSEFQIAAATCKTCAAGKYQDQIGQNSCKNCEVAKYGNNQLECFDIKPGFYPTNCLISPA